jgi:pimeloyl-ACP methyl ester carboxylesterase
VLVHGGFVEGSGWEGVHKIPPSRMDGFNVYDRPEPHHPRLAGTVEYTRAVLLAAKDGPAVLVGHSYGGGSVSYR